MRSSLVATGGVSWSRRWGPLSISFGSVKAATRIAAVLRSSKRPVVLAGNGIRIARAVDRFQMLARRIGAPVLTTRLGVDLLPASDPLCFGAPGMLAARYANFVLQNCDVFLVLGSRLDLGMLAYDAARFARGATRMYVNIDAAEVARLAGMVDIPVCADVGVFLDALLAEVPTDLPRTDVWLERCDQWRRTYPFVPPRSRFTSPSGMVSMYDFSSVLSDELGGNDVVLPGSSGAAAEVFLTALSVKAGQRVFHNKGTGAMGFGTPAAVGASFAAAGRRVVCIDGDGGFQFNVQELETVRRHGLPIKFFVVNNSGYACIRQSQATHFHRLSGADQTSGLSLPDVGKLARAYGLRTARLTDPRSMRRVVRRVLAGDDPCVCEVVVAPDEERMPRVQSVVRPDGSVVSKPLEDMWPYLDRDEFARNMIVPPVKET